MTNNNNKLAKNYHNNRLTSIIDGVAITYCMATTMHTRSNSVNPPIFIVILLHRKIKSPLALCMCPVLLQPPNNNNSYMDRVIL